MLAAAHWSLRRMKMATFKYPTGVLYSENTRRSRRRKTSHTVAYSLLAFIGLILVTLLSGMEAKASNPTPHNLNWVDSEPLNCLKAIDQAKAGENGVLLLQRKDIFDEWYVFRTIFIYRFRTNDKVMYCSVAKVTSD